MRKTILSLALTALPLIIWAQNSNFSMDVSQLRAETVYFPIQGTPYLDETYRFGEVMFRGEKYKLFFRFNALKDRVELKDRTTKLFHLQKNIMLEPTFGGKTYKYMHYFEKEKLTVGYLIPLYRGKATLYYKPKKIFVQAKSPDNGYHDFSPPHYKDVSTYYLQFGKQVPQPIKLNGRTLLGKFGERHAELEQYIKKQELDLREERDVIRLLKYYNRIS